MKKYSKQRVLILDSLKNRTDHPTAETLYRDLKDKMPEIGIATVYRNLSTLCEEGKINKWKSKIYGADRYDGNTMPHIHFECEKCGEIEDLFLKEERINDIDNEIKELVKKSDAKFLTSEIFVTGICKNCSNKII